MVLVYCESSISSSKLHTLYCSTLNAISIRDYKINYFSDKQIPCLDLDGYENAQTGQNDCTMDGAIGIASYINNRSSNPRLLLVELRFNYKSTNNFDRANMSKKISHSKIILNPQIVDETSIFLYTEDVADKAQNYFNRLSKQYSEIKKWIAMSNKSFISYIDFVENQPYTPNNNLDNIRQQLEKSPDYNSFIFLSEYWKEKADTYRAKYNIQEAIAIYSTLINAWEQYTNDKQDVDAVEYKKLELEHLNNILKQLQ